MTNLKTLLLFITTCLLTSSCSNEPYDLFTIGKIDAKSALFDSLKDISSEEGENKEPICLTFVYPFNVYLYNDQSEIVDSRIIGNNLEFIEALEATDQEGAIGLSYPIISILENGGTFSIQNNDELKEAIKACIESEIIRYCNSLLEEKNCLWKIISLTDNKRYDQSLLDFYDDGTGIFYDKGNAYRTSWISLFIDKELHINIRLEGNSETSNDWNFDWKATIIDENTVEISTGDKKHIIKKECGIANSCDYVEFRECELKDSDQLAEFVFENYTDCIISLQENVTDPTFLSLSFFESHENAVQETEALNTSSYQNSSNPQLVFVKTKNTNTNESNIIRIVLFVEACSTDVEP